MCLQYTTEFYGAKRPFEPNVVKQGYVVFTDFQGELSPVLMTSTGPSMINRWKKSANSATHPSSVMQLILRATDSSSGAQDQA